MLWINVAAKIKTLKAIEPILLMYPDRQPILIAAYLTNQGIAVSVATHAI